MAAPQAGPGSGQICAWCDRPAPSPTEGEEALNAVEIEQAITDLAEQPFDSETFPYAFLEAFGIVA